MATDHRFGGTWTEQKLATLASYLEAYTTALKNQPFRLAYIDAFAGTGYRSTSSTADTDLALFEGAREYLAGSARIALEAMPGFERYVFIDSNANHVRQLGELCSRYPHRDTRLIRGEANDEIYRLCITIPWREWRAVLFLDPYGMQVEWPTLEAIASTRAIDLWLLVPMGIAINRMLPNSGEVPRPWQQRLDKFFGTREWRDAAYNARSNTVPPQQEMFNTVDTPRSPSRTSLENIEQFFIQRLRTVFPAVLGRPLKLSNTRGTWLYSLFFAVASERSRAQEIALRIAESIVEP